MLFPKCNQYLLFAGTQIHATHPAFSFWQMGIVNAIFFYHFPQALDIYVCMCPRMYVFLVYQTVQLKNKTI